MKIIRRILPAFAWLAANFTLYVTIVAFDMYQNLFDWNPNLRVEAAAWGCGIIATLAFIWWLSKITNDRISLIVSALACLVLAGFAVRYGLAAERVSGGWLGRTTSSPWWYRGSRSLLFCLPGAFWLWRRRGKAAAT